MAVLFYALYFAMQFVCTLPKAPGLTAVSEAERYDFTKLQNTKKQRHCNGSKFPSLCLCLFCFVYKKVDAEGFGSKNFLRAPAWQKAVSCQRVKYDMKCF